MRTLTVASSMTINYPDNLVFSGDLNRIQITKNTTATHVEISFVIGGYTYNENLYFLTSDIQFSMSKILNLLFTRAYHSIFDTTQPFDFDVKLYNNTSLLDTFELSIDTVILGKRRIFDKLGELPNLETFDFDESIGLNLIDYYFEYPSDVYAMYLLGNEIIDTYSGLVHINLNDVSPNPIQLKYVVSNFMLNPSFQYLGGSNYWTTSSFPSCSSSFGVTIANKLVCVIPDESCGNTFTITYNGGTFTEGQQYQVEVNIDTVTNPSGNAWSLKAEIGGTQSTGITTSGVNSVFVTAGAGGALKLIAYMDADTGGFGSHAFSLTSIKVVDLIDNYIYLNKECDGTGAKIGLRFLNRFGMWRNYHVYLKTEDINAISGIKLPFLDYNYTEFNDTFAEINKGESQSINVFREGLDKKTINDFSDIISSDHVHLYDEINSVWIPIKVNTNAFKMIEKENLFDVNLTLLLQSENE